MMQTWVQSGTNLAEGLVEDQKEDQGASLEELEVGREVEVQSLEDLAWVEDLAVPHFRQ